MGFEIGETVGPYKITAHLSLGGMATIFKAHQTNLDRDVALKVIHPALKQDQSFVMRLKREASIIAKLNHPNIVTVYDTGEVDGVPYVALQFIDGKTLKDVLHDQKLSTQQILNIVRPVGDALAYAHARKILHRDVKPSNILIDNEGHVYLTDFGLARLLQSGESTASQDMLIGSPQYISPEQAKSEAVDARADVYALGVVMYEMFTGRVPFTGETPYATILAHINNEPPSPRSLNPKIRPAVEQVLLKALAKDPKQRYSSIREMIKALENAVRGPSEETEPAAAIPLVEYKPPRENILQGPISRVGDQIKTAASSRRVSPLPVIVGLGLLAVLLVCVATFGMLALRLSPLVARPPSRGISLGPSGVAVAGPTGSPITTLVPSPVSVTARPVGPQTATAASPREPASAAGAQRGRIAYSVTTGELAEQHSIWIANSDGSNPQKIVEIAMWPALSPDGKHLAYYRMKDEGIWVANSDGTNAHRILVGETCCVQWSRDSKRLIYVQGRLKTGDTRVKVVNPDGTNPSEINLGPSPYNPAWSPDGNKIAYASCNPASKNQCGIFIFDMNSKETKMITTDGGGNPQWSPRGDKIVYQAGNPNVFIVNPDGTGQKQLTFGKSNEGQPVWSHDGSLIFWRSDQDGKGWAIYTMRPDGSDKRLIINNAAPDGDRWGYESLSSGQ